MPNHTDALANRVRRNSFNVVTHFLGTLLFAIISADIAHAESYNSSQHAYPIDFALTFSNSDIDLRDGDTHYTVDMNRINISIFSLAEKTIQLGFNAGYNYLSLDNDPVLTGINLDGYHAGFAVRSLYGNNPQLGFQADYRYQGARDDTEAQSTTFNWNEWTIAATGKVSLGQRLRLMLGLAYSEIKARRNAQGDINDTLDMRLDSARQTQFELQWLTETDGRVSVALQRGAYESFAISFVQAFK